LQSHLQEQRKTLEAKRLEDEAASAKRIEEEKKLRKIEQEKRDEEIAEAAEKAAAEARQSLKEKADYTVRLTFSSLILQTLPSIPFALIFSTYRG
jgi:hypothetical protein